MPKPKHRPQSIELDERFRRPLDLIEHTSKGIFITGRADTGKSTLPDCCRRTTEKKVALLAPTGVAAPNVKRQTVHSFFGFQKVGNGAQKRGELNTNQAGNKLGKRVGKGAS
jgi:ATP-dependent DNA helicase PIF1